MTDRVKDQYDRWCLNSEDVLFLFRAGCAEWDNWRNSSIFHRIIDEYGTGDDKKRLAANNDRGYRYESISTDITPEDEQFLADCGILVE